MKQDTDFAAIEARRVYEKLSPVFSEFRSGTLKREDADTGANLAGKQLKALSIIVASRALDEGHLALSHKMKLLEDK